MRNPSRLRRGPRAALLVGLWAGAWGAVACGPEVADSGGGPAPVAVEAPEPPDPPHAKRHLVERNRQLRAKPPHPADGQGTARIVEGPSRMVSGVPAAQRIELEVGEAGIATGGEIVFRVTPYWSWSAPQLDDPDATGFTTVRAPGDGAELRARAAGLRSIVIDNVGRPLVAGDRIGIHYGAGAKGAVATIAEAASRLWLAVDGDGDGAYRYLPDSPRVEVLPGPAKHLVVMLPATAHPGARVFANVASIDAEQNAVRDWTGEVAFEAVDGVELPRRVEIAPGDGGHARVPLRANTAGIVRLDASSADGLEGRSNPMQVSAGLPRILWGDLHGHSHRSDGAGTPEDYFRYARDVAALDVIALTDHDFWGVEPLDLHPEHWEEIQRETRRFNEPGRFVTLLGFEWTNWVHGHRHVLFRADRGPLISAIDRSTDTPGELWRALDGIEALTLSHHSAGGPIATNWEIPPDPHFEPETEIASIHGSSEALDSPRKIQAAPGDYVRDAALARGYRLGFVGSGDNHAGQPGSLRGGDPPGGLAAILSEDLTRDGVFEAMRARRTYATNGPRIVLRATLSGHAMGASIPVPASGATFALRVEIAAQRPLRRVDLIRTGEVVERIAVDRPLDFAFEREISALRPDEYLYVRVVQHGGGAAWSSPFYAVVDPGGPADGGGPG